MKRCLLFAVVLIGCARSTPPLAELPPAYPRGEITDPKLAAAAAVFTTWATAQVNAGQPLYGRVEVLPPTDTLLPYGIGNFQKQARLPVLLITGPGWDALTPTDRETAAATAFRELQTRLGTQIEPTLTLQTPRGLELAWINDLIPGRKLIYGE